LGPSTLRRAQLAVKHGLDRCLAAVLVVVLAPLLGLIAALVKWDDGGDVFFTQLRAGRHAHPFRIVKFRTMIPDADSYLDAEGRPLRERVTRVGRFLRRWSLDELPQLVNVLTGRMSLIGPRPVPCEYAERMTERQRGRFALRPGITGLAQVRGRHQAAWSQRIEWDLEYIDAFSLLLDAKILALTVTTVLDPRTLTERGDPRKVDLG
jgi:lipopolysaccharide/colanic/teichoic acid biosynthesis glycosyltransferase